MSSNERVYYSNDARVHDLRLRTVFTILYLGIGLGIGAILALLFAPASGKTTRHELGKNMEEGLQSGKDNFEPTVKRLESEFADFRKYIEDHLPQS